MVLLSSRDVFERSETTSLSADELLFCDDADDNNRRRDFERLRRIVSLRVDSQLSGDVCDDVGTSVDDGVNVWSSDIYWALVCKFPHSPPQIIDLIIWGNAQGSLYILTLTTGYFFQLPF